MPEPTCVNLFARFGSTYVIDHGNTEGKWTESPWVMSIPCSCQSATIFPYGKNLLAVEVERRPEIVRRLKRLEGVRFYPSGQGSAVLVFDLALFEEVSEIVKPRKRRHVSDEEGARIAE